jgi:hypothetical protein
MFDKGSASIPRTVEELLKRENIMLSARAERFVRRLDDRLDKSAFLELYNGTVYTRVGNPRGGGLGTSIPGTVRELLVEEGIIPYMEAARFSEAVDRRLYGHNPLRLGDGMTYYLKFEVEPKGGPVPSFIPAFKGAPLRVDGNLVKRAVKARLSR